tara:strand:+ start:8294 stop:9013 length:720 start_codon:yes stop_codon:yes gene_type:complete
MPVLKALSPDDPLLLGSPLIRGVLKTAQYIEENGGIGLTKSGAFNRKFVHWAAAAFDWPGYSEDDLFVVNKVLNEWDFPPLSDIHELLKGLKLGRHFKGQFVLTKAGKELVSNPGLLFQQLTPNFLFRLDHAAHLRREDNILGNWDIFLNVINVESDHGATRSTIRKALYGDPDPAEAVYDRIGSTLYVTVLRPLCWAGLLREDRSKDARSNEMFTKTELWRRTLRLDTDNHLRPRVAH